jgi:Helix-turn-helix of DDE superfamily endonuclease
VSGNNGAAHGALSNLVKGRLGAVRRGCWTVEKLLVGRVIVEINAVPPGASRVFLPSGMTVSSRALNLLAQALRRRRRELRTRWRRLNAGRQALLVIAYLGKNETYTDLATGFAVGVSTACRYIREALDLLAAMATTLDQAMAVAAGKAYVILDGSLLRIDRVAMASGADRATTPASTSATG